MDDSTGDEELARLLHSVAELPEKVVAHAVGAPVMSVRRWRDGSSVPSQSRLGYLRVLSEFVESDRREGPGTADRLSRRLVFPDGRASPVSVADVLHVAGPVPARRCAEDPGADAGVLAEVYPRAVPVDDGLVELRFRDGVFTVTLRELGLRVTGTDASEVRSEMIGLVRQRVKKGPRSGSGVEAAVLARIARSVSAREGSSVPSLSELLFGSWQG